MTRKWYLSTPVIALLFALWFFLFPPIVGIVLLMLRFKQEKGNRRIFNDTLTQLQEMKAFNESIGFERYEDVTRKVESVEQEISDLIIKEIPNAKSCWRKLRQNVTLFYRLPILQNQRLMQK